MESRAAMVGGRELVASPGHPRRADPAARRHGTTPTDGTSEPKPLNDCDSRERVGGERRVGRAGKTDGVGWREEGR